MSLSTFLLGKDASKGKGKSIDKGLDDLFSSTPVVSSTSQPAIKPPTEFIANTERKRKEAPHDAKSVSKASKRAKGDSSQNAPSSTQALDKNASRKSRKVAKPVESSSESEKDRVPEVDEDSDGDEAGSAAGPSSSASPVHPPVDNPEESDSDEEGDPSKLVHESLLKGGKSKSGAQKKKYVPSEETSEQRDARTIFIGNVPVEVVTSRPLQKQLKRHILSFVPTAKIESTRFRSVAFSKPTAASSSSDATASKDSRQHNRDRAASWRESKSRSNKDDKEESAADKGKTFMTQNEKKRVFFIKQELHTGVDSVNAYVVFAHPPPATDERPSTLMDPYEAAKVVVKEADGSEFNGHTIRVDSAVKGKNKGKTGESRDAEVVVDPKATVFVGNLDFACKEEDVRAFFEKLMIEERGDPGQGKDGVSDDDDDEEEDEDEDAGGTKAASRSAWVKRVRIIRDKDTLLGKGFGYVQFTDRSCVDETLALEETRLKFAKRKLRVQRCKTLPGGSKPAKPITPTKTSSSSSAGREKPSWTRTPVPVVVPKGDPTLGSKLASLSKEERKQVKSSDADRVARRLAKKKAKALAEKGVKSRDAGGKDRERVRKHTREGAPEKRKAKVGRVRSGKALAKMNTKK